MRHKYAFLAKTTTSPRAKETSEADYVLQSETDSTSNRSDANGAGYRHKLPVTPEEISNLIESAIPQSTRCHYKWGYNVFSNWQKERRARPVSDNLPIPVEALTQSITEMEPCMRDTALQYFLAEAKKTDGNDYPSASLYQLFVAIQGQIRLNDPAVNLLTQPTYVKCRKVLDSMMKKRSAEGLGAASRRRAEPISSLEENMLWERAVIGSDNLPKLLDTMVYLNGIHFALRGGKEHRHRSSAVRSYKRTANFQQNESSEILYGKKQKTTTCTETKLQSPEENTSHDTSHQVVNIEAVRRQSVAEPTTLSFTFNIKL
ncbi:uncharacterized protein LOC134697564 [Mytilus trossulus]|uniref:uncharacterized protein LOC134697564 n=1 Tax=Mytilus trossulus TaxID=6551 RepID=UPI0030076EE1